MIIILDGIRKEHVRSPASLKVFVGTGKETRGKSRRATEKKRNTQEMGLRSTARDSYNSARSESVLSYGEISPPGGCLK